MSFFSSLTRTIIDMAETPVAIVKDVATLGGALTDQQEPYTIQKLKEVEKDLKKAKDALDD
jgi:hypothetical protein